MIGIETLNAIPLFKVNTTVMRHTRMYCAIVYRYHGFDIRRFYKLREIFYIKIDTARVLYIFIKEKQYFQLKNSNLCSFSLHSPLLSFGLSPFYIFFKAIIHSLFLILILFPLNPTLLLFPLLICFLEVCLSFISKNKHSL